MSNLDDYCSKYERARRAEAKANRRTKAAIFKALTTGKIERVSVTFDGAGDDGQIEAVTAYSSGREVPLPPQTVTIKSVHYNTAKLSTSGLPLSEAIEELCYAYLAQEHGGWENNDNAFGEFKFDVAARTITLEFEQRYTDSTSYRYEF